jgi:hypothetical protein
MHVALRQPARLATTVDGGEGSHRAFGITDETVARRKIAIGGHAEVTGAGTARIRPMATTMDLAHRIDHVLEGDSARQR